MYDREVKAPLYARHGITELWIVNLVQRHSLIYRDPTPQGYATTRVAHLGEMVGPLAFPDVEIAVADILG